MARLPIPGGDEGNWGQILNDFLAQTHKTDGNIKDNVITSDAIAPGAVTLTEVADGSISEAKLDAAAQSKLNSGGGTPGATGATGAVGAQGPAGSVGATGVAGPQGAAGATGAQGVQGATGSAGSVGPAGPAGATGAAGAAGLQGATGAVGSAGNDGATGATGAAGPAGATGATGGVGPQGATGPNGSAGSAGATGATGAQGATGPIGTAYVLNAQTGTSYTLVLGDADKFVTLTNAASISVTVPANASVAFGIGTRIAFAQMGAGQVTFVADGGVSLFSDPGLKIAAQYGGAELVKLATDTWILVGRLAA